MKNWFTNLMKPRQSDPARSDPEIAPAASTTLDTGGDLLALQKENQALRIELEARDQTISGLKQEVERLRLRQEQVVSETVAARLGSLFTDLAGPASQILTQAELLENRDQPVQARDVLTVARRMVRALERYGVIYVGKVGEQVAYDPNHHTAISGAAAPRDGQTVTVRFAAVTYLGKTIYKAIVE